MSSKLETSRHDGAHALLQRLTGSWQGTVRTWFEPGVAGDTSPVKGTIRSLLDGMFILHEYESTMQGAALKGLAIHGYFWVEGRWMTAWVDSFHNGTRIMLSQSGTGADPAKPDVLGHYPAPPGPDRGWRSTLQLAADDHLIITHYNIGPKGREDKAVEFDHRRVA